MGEGSGHIFLLSRWEVSQGRSGGMRLIDHPGRVSIWELETDTAPPNQSPLVSVGKGRPRVTQKIGGYVGTQTQLS